MGSDFKTIILGRQGFYLIFLIFIYIYIYNVFFFKFRIKYAYITTRYFIIRNSEGYVMDALHISFIFCTVDSRSFKNYIIQNWKQGKTTDHDFWVKIKNKTD